MPTARNRATRRSRGGGERLIGARSGQAVIAPEASSRQEVVAGEGEQCCVVPEAGVGAKVEAEW